MKVLIANAKKAEAFCQIFNNLKELCDVVTFRFSVDQIYIQGMDGSHVALYEIQLKKSWFDAYKLEETDARVVSISQDVLSRVLSMRQKNQVIIIDYKDNPDKLNMEFKNLKPTQKEFPKEYSLPLMEVDSELLEIPEVEYEVDFSIKAKTFGLLVGQLMNFDDNIKMNFKDTCIRFSACGDTLGNMTVDLYSDKTEYVEEFIISEDCDMNISFSLRYIHSFCQFDKLSDMMELHFSENYPMQLKYDMGDDSYIRFMLAPKLEE